MLLLFVFTLFSQVLAVSDDEDAKAAAEIR
jgi:hypothetical protein